MSKKESWRSSSKCIALTCLIIFSFGYTVECQEGPEGPERPKAFAAPTGLNALDIDGSNKAFFKIGPTRDGITRAIADEVSPGINLQFPPNSPNDSPAYDDNLVEAVGEEELFIPSIYRNETDKEKEEKKKTTTTRAPPTTTTRRAVTFGRETLPPAINTPRPPVPQPPVRLPPATQTFVPRPPPPPQTQPRFPQPPPATRPPPPIQTRPPPPPQTRPPPPPPPPQTRPPPPPPVFQTRPTQAPFVPQTRPPPPAPVFQTRAPQTLAPAPAPTRPPFQQPQPLPAFRPQQPQRPLQPQTLPAFQQPAQPFIPQLRPVQQTRPPPPPPPTTTPRPTFVQPSPPPQLQPFQQQPFQPRPRPVFQPQQQPQQQQPTPAPRPLRPFRPAANRPFRPRQRPQDPTGLRTGFCPFTIFYQSGPAAAFEAQQTYTHFASVVSVDQCARTCHEFKCDAAFFDSANRHCQFNPGQGSNAPPPSCPTYPSPFLRNNVPLSAVPLKISCITCQRRRRINRINGRVFTNRFGQTRRQFNPQVIGRSIANVVHGVLIKQPQSVAIGFGPSIPRQDSFRSSELESLAESLTEEEKRENAKIESEEKKEEKSGEKKEENVGPKINSDMILMNMHKLSSSEASEESKEILSNLESNINVIDSSTEAESEPSKASRLPLSRSSAEEEETKPTKNLHKSAGLIKKTTSTTHLHRILAADKPIESAEDSSMSFA